MREFIDPLALLLQPTSRLCLRLLGPEDRSLYRSLYTDAAAMRLIATPLSPEAAEADFERALRANRLPPTLPSRTLSEKPYSQASSAFAGLPWNRRSTPQHGLRVVAETPGSAQVVALFGLERWDHEGTEWEMGVMAPRHTHGRGYAVEGMSALADRLLEAGAGRVLLRCSPANLSACRVARRMGFRGEVAESPDGPVMLWARLRDM